MLGSGYPPVLPPVSTPYIAYDIMIVLGSHITSFLLAIITINDKHYCYVVLITIYLG